MDVDIIKLAKEFLISVCVISFSVLAGALTIAGAWNILQYFCK
jgi:hypothetical protein